MEMIGGAEKVGIRTKGSTYIHDFPLIVTSFGFLQVSKMLLLSWTPETIRRLSHRSMCAEFSASVQVARTPRTRF